MALTALVTGASAGIGRSLAFLFAKDGYDVVLVARREQVLQELAAEIARTCRTAPRVVAADLAEAGGAAALCERLRQDGVRVDVLVNNAGFGAQGEFWEISLERQVEMIQLNVTALTALTRLLLPDMIAVNRGGVLNVASIAAFQAGPYMAVYYATKAYVLSFTEALAEELAGTALRVSCLAPGPTGTGFAAEARMTESPLFRGSVMSADDVARIGYEGWKDGRVVVVAGARNRATVLASKLSPRAVARKIAARLNRDRGVS